MNKISKMLLCLPLLASLCSCDFGDKITDFFDKTDFVVNTTFEFYKDPKRTEKFESNTFEVNTKIYVFVDFNIQKKCDNEEIISFEVNIPYAEYYSTTDYYKGTIEPHKELRKQIGTDGSEYYVTILDKMNFVIDDKNTHEYHYAFEIEANQVCENAEFITRFKPENSNLKIKVNDIEDNKAVTTYTFVEEGKIYE